MTFDDAVTRVLRDYVHACDALEAAGDDAQVLHLSDMKALAALNLRKALTTAGWTAPVKTPAAQ